MVVTRPLLAWLSLWLGLTPTPHVHSFGVLFTDSHAEIDEEDPVRHTAFSLMACADCRHVEPFPRENFTLCTPRYRAALRERLNDLQWRLDA